MKDKVIQWFTEILIPGWPPVMTACGCTLQTKSLKSPKP